MALNYLKIAEQNNVLLLYEAAVAGGIPIIRSIKNNIFLNKINKKSGILKWYYKFYTYRQWKKIILVLKRF